MYIWRRISRGMVRNGEIGFGDEGSWALDGRGVIGDMMSGIDMGLGFGGGGK